MTVKPTLLNKGLSTYRFPDHPEEERIARAWDKENRVGHTLAYLLGDGCAPRMPTPREREVAATVMQWLGSPIGQCFLSELGYSRGGLR